LPLAAKPDPTVIEPDAPDDAALALVIATEPEPEDVLAPAVTRS
jgi:hypothetical protein